MRDLFQTPADLDGYLFRILDNGGASADRYTVMFSDGDYLALSADPEFALGISLWGEGMDPATAEEWVETGAAVDLTLADLPAHIARHIVARANGAWRDYLDGLERGENVARTRDEAELRETWQDAGKGIYRAGSAFCVRRDGYDAGDDLGPYPDVREALLASLPDHYYLAGPEYHTALDLTRAAPDPDRARAVRDLESRIADADAA